MAIGNLGRGANQVLIKINGDDKGYQDALKRSDKATGTFASKMKGYAPMIGAAFAAAAVGFVAMSVKMAAAEEAVSRQTEALLKSQGIMWGTVGEELDTYMKQLEELTAYNDTDLQVAFNSMIAAGMSYTDAMESMNTVTSMAFSLNRDLGSMALLVGKAYNGQTGELSRYGIVLDESLDKTEKFTGLQEYVAKNFADASERADTFEGQMTALTNETSNFAEAVGAELLPDLTKFVKLMVDGSDASGGFATKLGKALASPLRIINEANEMQPLNQEKYGLLSVDNRTDAQNQRLEVIEFELVRIQNAHKLTEANQQTQEWMQKYTDATYEALNIENAAANALAEKLRIEQEILAAKKAETDELNKQLTIEQRYQQIQGRIASSSRSIGNAKMSAGTAAELGLKNANITSSIRSGI